jgi:heme/copper-type cytochrome/quinol oxidase subunit 1
MLGLTYNGPTGGVFVMKLQMVFAVLAIPVTSTPSWAHHSFAAEYDSEAGEAHGAVNED